MAALSAALFHVSEEAGIRRFEPRPGADGQPRVWAITDARLHNYLLPRDCPRVTFYALATCGSQNILRSLGIAGGSGRFDAGVFNYQISKCSTRPVRIPDPPPAVTAAIRSRKKLVGSGQILQNRASSNS